MWGEEKKFRAVELAAVAVLTVVAGWLRFYRLGDLGLWGDEGFTYLAVEGVLKHGLPILPSGNGYYKDLLFTYLTAIPCFFGGMTEEALRLVNSFWGLALVPVFYFVGKRVLPAPLAFLGAALLAFTHWEITFAREARYYCQLQFFYLLALHFFYRGFVPQPVLKSNATLQMTALVFFFLATLTHQLAYTLLFCFFILALIQGPRALFKKQVVLFGVIFVLWVVLLQCFELFFWKAGSVAHLDQNKTLWQALFTDFHWGYFRQFYWLFPKMSCVAGAGALLSLLRLRREPLGFWVAIGMLCLLFMGIGQAHLQPRYIFYLYPLFLLAYLSGIDWAFRFSKMIVKKLPPPATQTVGVLISSGLVFATIEATNPKYAFQIPNTHYDQRLVEKFQVSTTFHHRIDYKTTGEYVRQQATPGDIIVGTHMVFAQIYAGRCDYWLWSAGKNTWDAIKNLGDRRRERDRYLGIPLIRSKEEFQALLIEAKGRRIWVVTTPSVENKGHIFPSLREFLESHTDKIQYQSPDRLSRVYLFE